MGQSEGRARLLACVVGGVGLCTALASCSGMSGYSGTVDPRYGVSTSARVIPPGEPVPKGGGVYRVGQPYVVAGQTYVPEENTHYRAEGIASWYGEDFHGRLTANGEVFDMNAVSAAHPTLPMPCYVRVTNLGNGRSLVVRVNDRGPYHQNRVIDVSVRAARLLGFHGDGLTRVRVEYVGRAPLEGSDDNMLAATLREGEPAPAPSRVMVASARPFFPQSQGAMPRTANVPVPPDRPLTLGQGQWAVDYATNTRQPVIGDPRLRTPTAVSVFATPSDDAYSATAATPAIISGRGLY
jgi:rare lipoprotein A